MTAVNEITGEILEPVDPEPSGPPVSALPKLDDESFLRVFKLCEENLEQAARQLGLCKQDAHRRLRESGARKLFGNGLEYLDETKPEPNRSKIPALMEYLTPAEVIKCLTEAHLAEPVWVEDKYDLTQVKKAMKDHGGEGQKALDNIYMPGTAKGKLVQL